MSDKKHTPEPFGYFKAEPFGWTDCAETDDGAVPLYEKQDIETLMQQRDELLDVFQLIISEMERRDRNDGNAPGHGHEIPGVWDRDNGELAGKPCAWCAVWKKAKELRGAIASAKGGAA